MNKKIVCKIMVATILTTSSLTTLPNKTYSASAVGISVSSNKTTLNTWEKINNGLPNNQFTVQSAITIKGEVYIALNDGNNRIQTGLYKFNKNTNNWTKLAKAPMPYGMGNIAADSKGNVYTSFNNVIYRYNGNGGWTSIVIKEAKGLGELNIYDDKIYQVSEGINTGARHKINIYDTTTGKVEVIDATGLPTKAQEPHGIKNVVVYKGQVFVSYPWSYAKRGEVANIFRYDRTKNTWVGVSGLLDNGGIDMRNMLGNPDKYGQLGDLTIYNGDLLVSTEQGTFKYLSDGQWQKISASWGAQGFKVINNKLFVIDGNGVSFVDGSKSTTLGQDLDLGKWGGFKQIAYDGENVFAFVTKSHDWTKPVEDYGMFKLTIDKNAAVTDNNLNLSTGTYLKGNKAGGVSILSDGTIVTASDGVLNLLSKDGSKITNKVSLGEKVYDLALAKDIIYAVGNFGVKAVDKSGKILWTSILNSKDSGRVAAYDNKIATLSGKNVKAFDNKGKVLFDKTIDMDYVNDVAVKGDTLFVTGFNNRKKDGVPVQIAKLIAYRISDGKYLWDDFNYNAKDLANDMADTRGYKVSIGEDGMLYFMGETAGGNSIFRWNGKDLKTSPLVKTDIYNDPFNTKSAHMTYYARINPETGEILKSQFIIPRIESKGMISNTFTIANGDITADKVGNIYITGTSAWGIQGRDLKTINGQKVGTYAGGDLTLFVASPDLKVRKTWTTFNKDAAKAAGNGIAVKDSKAVILGTVEGGNLITTNNALIKDSSQGKVYMGVWNTK